MRLDEWQKFIESQFLEETTARPPAEKSVGLPRPDPQTTLLLDAEPPIPLAESAEGEPAAALSLSVQSVSSPLDASLLRGSAIDPEVNRPRVTPDSLAPQTTARQTGFVVRSVVEAPVAELAPLPAVSPIPFEATLDLDPPIPIFSDYLPSASPEPDLFSLDPPPMAALLTEEAPEGAMSVLLPLTSGFVSTTQLPERPLGAGQGTADRRRTRAPQARNVQPENVASGLSSADLWAQVPRHVQTLLALERREEEREVAQSSYKRPFQEKRAELIARILDPVLSLEDTARLLNVCPTTVRRYTNKGILTHYRKEPDRPSANATERETRQRRFRLSDILTFLETQQSALADDRLHERIAPSRRKRSVVSPEASSQD